MKKLIILISILLNAFGLPAKTKTKRGLDDEKSNDIVILHTNDVHCGVQDTIGYDGLMLYKKQLLEKYNNVLLVDAGDHIQGGTIGMITSGAAIIEIMNKLEYDVATLGNHEFDYGIPTLEEAGEYLNCSYISSNYCYRANKTSIYPPYKMVEIGGKKIGFIGVATPQTLSKTYLITIVDESGKPIYDFLTENHSQELYERVQKHIDDLQEQGADYVIILGHLGIGGDALEENTSAGLLKNLKSVNALIDGHSHLVYSLTTPDQDGKQVILVQTGTKLANIGVLTIHENGTLSHENINEVPYDPNLAEETLNVTRSKVTRYVDKEMNEYINNITDSFAPLLQHVIGKTDFDLNVYRNSSESTESHTQLSRVQENALCNLVSDALRILGEADVTIINAGTVRTDIKEGNITYQHIINTMPFSNDVLSKEITGQTILDALEFGTRILPDPTSRFPQVSGITYKIDTSINTSVVVDENEVFKNVSGERRVYDVKVNGEDLDVNKKYTISSNSFILGGGDGYSMFTDFEITKTSAGVDNEVLLKYIKDDLNGVVPEQYMGSEGRIVKTNGKIQNNITKNIHLSLLGFNEFNYKSPNVSFYAYLTSLENIEFEYPKMIRLPLIISSNSKLRVLEESVNATCLYESENNKKAKYLCESKNITSGSNNIQAKKPSIDNFEVEVTPLAFKYMKNMSGINNSEELDNLDDTNVYILQNSSIIEQNDDIMVVSGEINSNESVSFSSGKLNLTCFDYSNQYSTDVPCTIVKTSGNKFNLTCLVEDELDCNLDNSMLADGNKILIVDFEEGTNGNITIDPDDDDNTGSGTYRKNFYRKSSGGLSGGLIALIVILPIVLVAIVAALIFLLKKSNSHDVINSSNSVAPINLQK